MRLLDKEILDMLGQGIWDSLYMTIFSTVFAYIIGLPLGVVLVVTEKGGIRQNRAVNLTLGVIINILRSVPFLILAITIRPLTRLVVGTTIGSKATIVALVVAAAPFVARVVESSLKEVDKGVIEAAQSMGASTMDIICKVLVPEAKSSLIIGGAIAVTTILGYSAMAGFIAGGGLGDIAIRYGYYRYETGIMLITVLLLVLLVQIFQEIGMRLAKIGDKRR